MLFQKDLIRRRRAFRRAAGGLQACSRLVLGGMQGVQQLSEIHSERSLNGLKLSPKRVIHLPLPARHASLISILMRILKAP